MLYGRDAERALISGLLEDARSGRSGVLVLRGEPGVGKSALLDDAQRQADEMLVLSCCGVESEAHLPYAGLHQILRPVLDHTGDLPGPQARALRGALGMEEGASDEWFLVSLAVLTLLAEAAERRPIVCLVDDAHWLDDASAESLVFAARRLHADPIAMLFAAREGEVRSFEAPGLSELRLEGLRGDDAAALLEHQVDTVLSPEARARLIEGTGGNPLGLLELSSTLDESQLAGLEPLLDPLPVGARVERAFLARARRLPEETQTLLLVAAADESGVPATVLAAAARLGVLSSATDAAEQAGLIRVEPTRVSFRHPLIRSAVYQAAPFSRRCAVHEALASVLQGEANADRRAWHRAAACVNPDAGVAEELEQAARRARQRSGFVAASLGFERAAALTTDERRRVHLLLYAVEGAWFAGRLERARMLLDRARSSAEARATGAEIDRWRGLIELNEGVPSEAREILVDAAMELLAADTERGLYLLGLACVAAGYAGEGGLPGIAARAAGVAAPDTPVGRFLVHFLRGTGAHFSRDFEAAAPDLRAALEQAEEADDAAPPSLAGLLILGGGAGLFLGDDRAADRLNRRLAARARESGALTLLTQALPRLALTQLPTGQWPSASAALKEGVELARQTGQHQVVAHMLSMLALIAALRGDEDECRSLAAESRELASIRSLVHVAHTARWALLVLELGLGRADDALGRGREISELPIALWAGPDRVEAAFRAGERDLAVEWLEEYAAWAETSCARQRAAAFRCRALLAEDDGETERLFAASLEADPDAAFPFERARTELAFGEFLRRARRRVEARDQLRPALDRFEALGAAPWAERARMELRASGQTARRRELSTIRDLTAQEIQIARFVGQGLTNREVAAQLFLSPRTVEFHLRNVYRKLGITSRMQLVQHELGDVSASPVVTPVRA